MSNTSVLDNVDDSLQEESWSPQAVERDALPKSPGLLSLYAIAKTFSLDAVDRIAKDGGNVVWGFVMGWSPLFRSLGYISGEGGLIMDSIRLSAEAVSAAESHCRVPVEICTPVKARCGIHHLRRPHNTIKKHVQFAGDCGMSDMMAGILPLEGIEVHTVEPLSLLNYDPARRPQYVQFYVNEIQRLAHWLTGKPVDEAVLAQELHDRNLVTRKIETILKLREKNPYYLTLGDVFVLAGGSNDYFATDNYEENKAKYNAILDQIIAEFDSVPENHDYIPLLKVGGCPFCGELCKVVDDAGGAIVGNNMVEPAYYREDVNPVESLAHFMIDQQLSGRGEDKSGGVFTNVVHHIEHQIEATGAKGVIVTGVINCPYTSIAQQYWQDYFKKKGVPFIVMLADTNAVPTEEVKMRLKAFVEMLV
jgi:hypothetical protein